MKRRTLMVGFAGVTAAGLAGCLGEVNEAKSDREHIETLRGEIDDRGVGFESVELEDGVVEVVHGFDEDPNDAIANVAMAFVERIAEEWDVDRLDGYLTDEGNVWTWYAESEWAQAYTDGEIDPEGYGARLSETLSLSAESEE